MLSVVANFFNARHSTKPPYDVIGVTENFVDDPGYKYKKRMLVATFPFNKGNVGVKIHLDRTGEYEYSLPINPGEQI